MVCSAKVTSDKLALRVAQRKRDRLVKKKKIAARKLTVLDRKHGAIKRKRKRDALEAKKKADPEFAADRKAAISETYSKARIKTSKEQARQELARRELARRKLLPFILRNEPNYNAGWVHKDICERLERFSQDVVDGKEPRLMLFMPPRHGKLNSHDTPVLTPTGWRMHGTLRAGDKVMHPSGKPVTVINISEESMADYEVEFSNGEVISCHGNHEWTIYDRTTKSWKTVETNWFVRQTKFGEQVKLKTGTRYKFQLPEVAPMQFPKADVHMQPYVLGAWLGDGYSKNAAIAHSPKETEVITAITACGYAPSTVGTHPITGVLTTGFGYTGMTAEMRAMKVWGNKRIPHTYKFGSIEQRLDLLAGLVDTDGHVEPGTGRIRIVTGSKGLADDIAEVATTLGFRPYIMEASPALSSSGIQGGKTVYTVGFQPTLEIPTQLPRKKNTRFAKQRRIAVVDVRLAKKQKPGQCIQVDSPDGLYVVGKKLIPTHNSMIASQYFPAWHLGKHPDHEVIQASYAQSLQMDFSRKVQELIKKRDYQILFPNISITKGNEAIERWGLSVLVEGESYPQRTGGGLLAAGVGGPITGRGAHIAIIDDPVKNREEADSETARRAVQAWYSSTLYTRLAPGGGILVIQTRWHDDDLSGYLLDIMKDAERQARDEGEWPEDADHWEVVEYPAIATKDERFRKAGEALHPARYDEKSLLKKKRSMAPRDWAALFQQNPQVEEGAYFEKRMIRYYDSNPPRYMDVYVAGDLAISQKETADWTVFYVVGIDENDDVYVLDERRGRWSDSEQFFQEILSMHKQWTPRRVGVEKGQISMSLEGHFNRRIRELKKFDLIIEQLPPGKKDKRLRARPIQGRMSQGKVFWPRGALWVDEAINEFLRFDSGVNDDRVDAMAWIGQMLADTKFQGRKKKRDKSWKQKLAGYMHNEHSSTSVMAA